MRRAANRRSLRLLEAGFLTAAVSDQTDCCKLAGSLEGEGARRGALASGGQRFPGFGVIVIEKVGQPTDTRGAYQGNVFVHRQAIGADVPAFLLAARAEGGAGLALGVIIGESGAAVQAVIHQVGERAGGLPA